jgi:hypothetical protein
MNSGDVLKWSSIALKGSDALTFAQGQFSQEIGGDVRATTLLQPSGDVVSAGWVSGSSEHVDFLIPTELVETSVQRLRRFLLRVDVEIEVLHEQTGPFATVGSLFESDWPGVEELALGLPPHSYGTAFVAECVSFSKGCFTGQELVGRADARGATMPWRFAMGRCRDVEKLVSHIKSCGPEGPQGVTSWCGAPQGQLWRGVVHRTWDPAGSEAELRFRA